MSYTNYRLGMRWRTVAKPEKADGTVARRASIFVAEGCVREGKVFAKANAFGYLGGNTGLNSQKIFQEKSGHAQAQTAAR